MCSAPAALNKYDDTPSAAAPPSLLVAGLFSFPLCLSLPYFPKFSPHVLSTSWIPFQLFIFIPWPSFSVLFILFWGFLLLILHSLKLPIVIKQSNSSSFKYALNNSSTVKSCYFKHCPWNSIITNGWELIKQVKCSFPDNTNNLFQGILSKKIFKYPINI